MCARGLLWGDGVRQKQKGSGHKVCLCSWPRPTGTPVRVRSRRLLWVCHVFRSFLIPTAALRGKPVLWTTENFSVFHVGFYQSTISSWNTILNQIPEPSLHLLPSLLQIPLLVFYYSLVKSYVHQNKVIPSWILSHLHAFAHILLSAWDATGTSLLNIFEAQLQCHPFLVTFSKNLPCPAERMPPSSVFFNTLACLSNGRWMAYVFGSSSHLLLTRKPLDSRMFKIETYRCLIN